MVLGAWLVGAWSLVLGACLMMHTRTGARVVSVLWKMVRCQILKFRVPKWPSLFFELQQGTPGCASSSLDSEIGTHLTIIVLPCFSFFVGTFAPLLLRFFAPSLRCFVASWLASYWYAPSSCVRGCAWCLARGAWCLVLAAWCLAFGAWCLLVGAWCLVLGAWCLVLGAWCLVLGAWCLVFGAWCLVLGAWCLLDDADQDCCPSRLGALENAPVPDLKFRVPK